MLDTLVKHYNAEHFKILTEGVLTSASWLNSVIFIGAGILITINLYRIFHNPSIEINKLSISINKSWMIIAAYTVAHCYCAITLIKATDQFLEQTKGLNQQQAYIEKKLIWEKITLSGDFTFRRMEQRKQIGEIKIPFFKSSVSLYNMSFGEISNWIYFCMVVSIINGVADYNQKNNRKFFLLFSVAIILAMANWIIGSYWTTALSDLLT